MSKIAIMETMHPDGYAVLKNYGFEILEIKDLSFDNLINKLNDVEGIAIRTAKLTSNTLWQCS